MQEKKQTKRYTDEELATIKNTFNENDSLLKAIRKVFLQSPLNALDLSNLEIIKKEGILKILRKTFLPTIDVEAPLNQIIDLWMTIDLKDRNLEESYMLFQSRDKLIKYLDQQIKVLEGSKKETIKFKSLSYAKRKTPDQAYIDYDVRNRIILHTEMMLQQLEILSLPEETEEEKKERQLKDSAK
jgi:hypothetical protein